jgi:hypothetical protein
MRGVIFSSSSGCAAPGRESLRREDPHPFVHKAGRGDDAQQFAQALRRVSCFLEKFPPRAGRGVSFGSLRPGHEFPQKLADRVPVLADERTRPSSKIGSTTTDPGCTMMSRSASHAARLDHRVALQTETLCLDRELRSLESLRVCLCQIVLRVTSGTGFSSRTGFSLSLLVVAKSR